MRLIPIEWLPRDAQIARVIIHWTGGAYTVSGLDRKHYHAIIARRGAKGAQAVRGNHSPAANNNTADGAYAGHTKGLNTRSFGLSAACMAGAREGGPYGSAPLTPALWEGLARGAAEVCHRYGLPVNERTVLQHGEVQRVYGIAQAGKWDCKELPWDPDLAPAEVCAQFRRKVQWYLDRLNEEEAGQ